MLRNDPVLRRILKNSGWLLSAKGASLPIGLLQSVLLARLLGVGGFGAIGVVAAYVTTARRLISFRMDEVMVKFLTDALIGDHDRRRAAATLKLGVATELAGAMVALGLIWLSIPWVAKYFLDDPGAERWVAIYALTLVTECVLESTTGALQVLGKFRVQAVAEVTGKLVTLALVIEAFFVDRGMTAVMIAYLIGSAVTTALMVWALAIEAKERLGAGWWQTPISSLRGRMMPILRFAVSTNLGQTLSLIVKDSELLWLAFFAPPTSTGYYRMAKNWISLVVVPAGPLVKSFYPEIAKTIAGRDIAGTRRLLRKGSVIAAIWIVPVGVLFAASGWLWVPIFYGAEFLPALWVFAILLVGIGFADIAFWMRPVLLALGRPDVALRITAFHTVLKVGLVTLLVPIGTHLAMAGITGGLFVLGTVLGGGFALRALRRLDASSHEEGTKNAIDPEAARKETAT